MGARRTVTNPPPIVSPAAGAVDSDGVGQMNYPGLGKMAVFWTVVSLFTLLRNHFFWPGRPDMNELVAFVGTFACYCPWIAITPAVFRIEARYPLGTGRWMRSVAMLAAISVPVCVFASALMAGAFVGVMTAIHGPLRRGWDAIAIREIPLAEAIFWCSVAGGYFFRTLIQLREQERRAAKLALEKSQLEASLNQAQLEALRARLNPHFLFNSLQNISVMARQDPQTTSRMLTRLGDLLRAVLRQDSSPETTLYEELELTRAYAALEQMRFGERLQVEFQTSGDVQRAMVPCFLLQPLVENAVKHGLRGARKTGVITVAAAREGGDLVMTVTDNGAGPPDDDLSGIRIGVGLQSTCERLAKMYGERHAFSMRKVEAGGTEVRIAIPLRLSNEEAECSSDEHPAVTDR